MSTAAQIGNTLVRLLNLLTFFLAVLGFSGLCHSFWKDRDTFKSAGDIIFGIALLGLSGGIIWKSGKWGLSKSQKTDGTKIFLFFLRESAGKCRFGEYLNNFLNVSFKNPNYLKKIAFHARL